MSNKTVCTSKLSNITQIKVSPKYKKRELLFTPNEISLNYINDNDNQEIIPIESGRSKSGHSKKYINKINKQSKEDFLDNSQINILNDNFEERTFSKKNSLLTEENFNAIILSINELCGRIKKERKKTSENKRSMKKSDLDFQKLIRNRLKKKTTTDNMNKFEKINNLSNFKFNEDEVRQLSNMEDITNFYTYTERCFEMMIEIEKIKNINKCKPCDFPFDNEINIGNKKLAIFDLDETLVHCQSSKINKCQYQIEVNLPSRKKGLIGINIRPNWEKALNIIKDKYIIVVFTASHSTYADAVLNFMDPNNKYFKYRLYRNNCTSVKYEGKEIYIKDLTVFKNIDLKNIIIIDNSVVSFTYQLNNGMPILPYYDSERDNELICLAYYLMRIYDYEDLREANKLYVKLDYYKEAAIEKLKMEEEEEEEDDLDQLSFLNKGNYTTNTNRNNNFNDNDNSNNNDNDNNNNNNKTNNSDDNNIYDKKNNINKRKSIHKVVHFEEEIMNKKEDVRYFPSELKESILGLKKLIPQKKNEDTNDIQNS